MIPPKPQEHVEARRDPREGMLRTPPNLIRVFGRGTAGIFCQLLGRCLSDLLLSFHRIFRRDRRKAACVRKYGKVDGLPSPEARRYGLHALLDRRRRGHARLTMLHHGGEEIGAGDLATVSTLDGDRSEGLDPIFNSELGGFRFVPVFTA